MRAPNPARPDPARGAPDSPGQDSPDDAGSVHWILRDDVVNARDLGGTVTEDGRTLVYDAIFRGPPLAGLSAAGCIGFGELGIRTVIDLRIDSERTTTRNASCVAESADVVEAPLPVPYSVSAQDYIAILNAHDSIAAFFEQLGDETAYPIYFHCTFGRDRTGVLAAVILRALGVSRADILQEYLLSQPTVGAYPRSLEAGLDAIEAAGGIEAYLASAGVSNEELATLRARVLAERE